MFNGTGLKGHHNTTQSALIIPKPSSFSIYYLFTLNLGLQPGFMGLYYSTIDMTQQGGLGSVTTKNKILIPSSVSTTEKLVGVRQCNGKDYWVIAHLFNSNTFNAYRVTSIGVDSTPVISSVGSIQQNTSGTFSETKGYLKASPDGKKLALAYGSDSLSVFEIFDFNNSTGVVSNPITINYPAGVLPYGVSFSPDNSKVYVSHNLGGGKMYQYDLSSGISSTIISSQILVANNLTNSTTFPEALQLAPNGKIYLSRYYLDTLAVINNPNNSGTSCGFQLNGPVLQGLVSFAGLPNFIDANYAGIQVNIPDVQQCNTFTGATLDAGTGFSTYQWSTGATTQTINVTTPGEYWVTVTNDQGCQRTDTVGAYVLIPGKETILVCDTFHANVVQGGVLQYNWYDGLQNPIRDFTQSGQYWVDINYVAGCAIRDSIDLTVVPSPQIDIGPDSTFCKGNLVMNAACSTCNYQWSTGATTPSIVATTAGNYWIKVTDANGCVDSDTLLVKPQLVAFNFEMPNIVTPNDDNINDAIDFGKYQFSTLQIAIYNRWGQQVFSSDSADAIWKPEGEAGAYFYTAQYKIECGVDTRTRELKGHITLLR